MEAEEQQLIHSLVIYLIKASKYDDDGYVIRHWRGVLPSNSLACLYGLTEDVRRRNGLGADLNWKVEVLDESVHKIDVKKIVRSSKRPHTKTIVCLVGVQTNQFPRASDLAMEFRKAGVTVLIGGFHVSGSIAMLHTIPPEIQAVIEAGCTVVLGEVEEHLEEILEDAVEGKLQPVYDYLADLPDLQYKPIPKINKKYLKKFITPNFGTIDCGRGCPFNCTFCTIINVQGRKMRMRDPEALAQELRYNYHQNKVTFYFFTDDNFARNKYWEQIFDTLIDLRRSEGIEINFLMQVDVLSYKIKNFVRKAREAGCGMVFIGMESINQKNLEAAGKRQNDANDFVNLIQAYHDHHISTHVGYIIGFPFDTRESVLDDVRRLANEIKVDQASFFMLTPLPGCQDHLEMVQRGEEMDSDYNRFDSFHETMKHPSMKPGEWQEAYRSAWEYFYGFENMKQLLLRTPADRYWDVFKNCIWYKSSSHIEDNHPMITGFFRLKDRLSRRPGYVIDPWFVHVRKRSKEIKGYLIAWVKLFLEMEELWLQTRKRSVKEQWVIDELQKIRSDVKEWRKLRVQELHEAYARAAVKVKELHGHAHIKITVPSNVALYFKKLNILSDKITYSRKHLDEFWYGTLTHLRRGRLHRINVLKIAVNFVRDVKLSTQFAVAMFGGGIR
jgi:radical SAM superfamily enzyme YgiQ (UPF0313 family)